MHTQYNNIQHKKRVMSKGALENHFFCPVGLFLPTSLVSAAPQSPSTTASLIDPCVRVSCVRVYMPNVRAYMYMYMYDVARAYDMSQVIYRV